MSLENDILKGNSLDVLKTLPDESINMVITSPPYYSLRDYGEDTSTIWDGWKGQLGLEPHYDMYIKHLCDIFDEVKRVLREDGTCWVNIGDTYSGGGGWKGIPDDWDSISTKSKQKRFDNPSKKSSIPSKSLMMIPFRFAIEMVNRGWILRNTIIWKKNSCIPESVKDRFTINFEYIFFFSKNRKYYFNQQFEKSVDPESYKGRRKRRVGNMASHDLKNYHATGSIGEDGWLKDEGKKYPFRNKRAVWTINPKPFPDAHFACVDEETECLTMRGWKSYNEVKQGESIATFDLNTGKLRWERVEDVYIYKHNGEMIKFDNLSFPFQFTPNHRMVCQNWKAKSGNWSKYYIKRADEVTSYDRFPVSAQWEDGSFGIINEPSKDMCELLGWICSEGHIRSYSINIYQSKSANPKKVKIIKKLLDNCGLDYSYNEQDGKEKGIVVTFGISWKGARKVMKWIPEGKKPDYKMVLWSKEAIRRFLTGFIGGDGHIRKDDKRISITQKNEETIDILQIMGIRLGYRVIKSKKKSYECGFKDKNFRSSEGYNLFFTNKKRTSVRSTNGKGITKEKINYEGIVWCPKTPATTFVARKNGRIVVTGNTFPSELCETPIKAGCPRYVCKKCGKPKVMERKKVGMRPINMVGGKKRAGGDNPTYSGNVETPVWDYNLVPSCDCNAEFEPGIVLDPFSGAGSALLTARKLGRRFLGIEISQKYIDMSKKRLGSMGRDTNLEEFW